MSTKPMQMQADVTIIVRDGQIERVISQRSQTVKIIDFDGVLVEKRAADVLTAEDEAMIERYEQRIYDRQREDDKA